MKTLRVSQFLLGACYYPEQWPESLWEDDFRRMADMGLRVVRMAEFAWSLFEPVEGRFEFGLFDRAMDLAQRAGIDVILGTPTATPPAWLTAKYPEVLNVSREGVVQRHGERRHCNYNAPVYRDLSARIAGRMAEHYCNHVGLLGWQIDNELNCGADTFYSDADHAAFRIWLKARYSSLDALNAAWGTVFWNQTYSAWEQVFLTRPTPSNAPNPHLALDEKRFISDTVVDFVRLQVDEIRRHDAEHWITTNGLFGHIDYNKLTRDTLDFISYDSYPQFGVVWPDGGEHPLLDRRWSANLAVTRSVSPQFCVMEQQSGPGGWVTGLEQPTPKPGQLRLWTYQSIAHGADMLLYFRWRTATFGTEIYWHGINDYHNRPNRRCAEVAAVGRELAAIGEQLVGTTYAADVAILRDYDNEWDGELDTWHGPFEKQSYSAWFAALQHRHVPVDVLYLDGHTAEFLGKYRTLIYPHPTILTESTADLLNQFVRGGGRLIMGCRTGYKNANGHCRMMAMPGLVSDLCGVEVEEFTRIAAAQTEPQVDWPGAAGAPFASGPFNDVLRLTGHSAKVIATYGEGAGHYKGEPAIVENSYGDGTVLTYGGVFNVAAAAAIAEYLGLRCPLADVMRLPIDIEFAVRRSQDDGYVFLLNYSSVGQKIAISSEVVDLLSGDVVCRDHTVQPYGVVVLRESELVHPSK